MLRLVPIYQSKIDSFRLFHPGLVLIFLCQVLSVVHADDTSGATHQKFPPYPDVWDYVMKVPRHGRSLMTAPDGDITVFPYERATARVNNKTVRSSSGVGFFSREISPMMSSQEKYDAGYTSFEDSLLHGRRLMNGTVLIAGADNSSAHCGDALGHYLSIGTEGKEPLREVRFMYLLEEPEFVEATYCEKGEAHYRSVVSLYFRAIELQDGTLLAHSPWVLIRLNPDLTTNSKLLNSRIFIVPRDTDPYQELNLPDEQRTAKSTQEAWMKYLSRIQQASQLRSELLE